MGTFDNLTQEEKNEIRYELGYGENDLKRLCDAYDALNMQQKGISLYDYLMSHSCGLNDGEIIQYAKDGSLGAFLESLEEDGDSDTSATYNISNRSIAYPFHFSPQQVTQIYDQFHHECQSSEHQGGTKEIKRGEATIDHIVPLAEIFNHSTNFSYEQRKKDFFNPRNLQLMCRDCNSRKGSGRVEYDPNKIAQI